jgi:hypothetical protein
MVAANSEPWARLHDCIQVQVEFDAQHGMQTVLVERGIERIA